MLQFGNLEFFPFIAAGSAVLLLVYGLYLFWKRNMAARLSALGVCEPALYRGTEWARRFRYVSLPLAILLFGFVLLRPQWGERTREVTSEGTDVLIMLDVSRSMTASDVVPSRLDRGKSAVRWIANSLTGDRIGLLLFAGDAFVQCPFTRDMGAFMMFLDAASPDSIHRQGTDFTRAFETAYRVFTEKRMTSRMLIVVTDGEDHSSNVMAVAKQFRDLDVAVYTLAVGTGEGVSITVPGSEKLFYRGGEKNVVTKLETKVLKQISGLTGGAYIDITRGMNDLGFILEIIADQQKNQYEARTVREPVDRFAYFAVALYFLLLIDLFLPDITRRKPKKERDQNGS